MEVRRVSGGDRLLAAVASHGHPELGQAGRPGEAARDLRDDREFSLWRVERRQLAVSRCRAGHVTRPVGVVSEDVAVREPRQGCGGHAAAQTEGQRVGVHHVVEGGRVQRGLGPRRRLASVPRQVEILHDLAGRRHTVVRQVLGQQLAEERLEVRVDGEGSPPGLGRAALVDVVSHQ